MFAKYFVLSGLVATVLATACTQEQLTAHGLTGSKQTVLFSRVEDNADGSLSIYEKHVGEEGGFVCTVASSVVYPEGVSQARTDNKLFARCTSKRDETTVGDWLGLNTRGSVCPCVGNTCDNGVICKDRGCKGGCGCIFEDAGFEPAGLVCACV